MLIALDRTQLPGNHASHKLTEAASLRTTGVNAVLGEFFRNNGCLQRLSNPIFWSQATTIACKDTKKTFTPAKKTFDFSKGYTLPPTFFFFLYPTRSRREGAIFVSECCI